MRQSIFSKKKILKLYPKGDEITQRRACFIYYLVIVGLIGTLIALLSTLYQSYILPDIDYQLPILICIGLIHAVFWTSLFCLYKKRLKLTGNIIFYGGSSILWGIIFLGATIPSLSRLNTFFYMLTALTMLPLIIQNKNKVFYFWIINILMLVLLFAKITLLEYSNIKADLLFDTFFDAFLSLSFASVAVYAVFDINDLAVKSAFKEVRKREEIAIELESHKENLEKLVEQQTQNLKSAYLDLKNTNSMLSEQNEIINSKNKELEETLKNLKQAQTKLVQTYKMASLGVLTAGIAHEINNPLNYIKGAYVGLNDYYSNNNLKNEDITFLLESIKVGLDKTKNIVDGLNQFSRTNESFDEMCNIHNIIDNCLTILSNQYKYKVDISKAYKATDFKILGNNGRLHQVFNNVLRNAIQAIDESGIINISTINEDGFIVIYIEDNGQGISKKNLELITDPFFTTKDPGEGTGLGLSISYSIVQEHNGFLTFDSELQKGTTVTLKFPNSN